MVTHGRKDSNYIRLVSNLLLALSAFVVLSQLVLGADPDPLQDFCVALDYPDRFVNGFLCKNPMEVIAKDFKSEVLKMPGNTDNKLGANVTLASAVNFKGLNTQGLSIARIDFAPKHGLNPPHVHPRATEVLFLVQGKLQVGFIDSTVNNNLFAQTLYAGDLFVFPRGLVHFQINLDDQPAMAIAALNSQNPGASQVAKALFAANPPLPQEVLEIAFGIDEKEVDNIIQGVKETL